MRKLQETLEDISKSIIRISMANEFVDKETMLKLFATAEELESISKEVYGSMVDKTVEKESIKHAIKEGYKSLTPTQRKQFNSSAEIRNHMKKEWMGNSKLSWRNIK